MGVKDLWQLLAPIGRRVSIETLEGKVLAIDMSIWITQFIKAMRDDEGKMVRNAHIIGTIRRILRLLFHKIKPVFIFDGETPVLKARVIKERRKVHERHESNRKAAVHKLILNQLKQRLEIGMKQQSELSGQKPSNFAKGFELPEPPPKDTSSQAIDVVGPNEDHYENIEWEEHREVKPKSLNDEDSSDESDHEEPSFDIPENYDELNTQVLSSLPTYMRKRIIEDARRKERMKSRSRYITVAEDPSLYSQTQLANFLVTSKLNKRFEEAQQLIDGSTEDLKRIASEGNKRYRMGQKDSSSSSILQSSSSSYTPVNNIHGDAIQDESWQYEDWETGNDSHKYGNGGFILDDGENEEMVARTSKRTLLRNRIAELSANRESGSSFKRTPKCKELENDWTGQIPILQYSKSVTFVEVESVSFALSSNKGELKDCNEEHNNSLTGFSIDTVVSDSVVSDIELLKAKMKSSESCLQYYDIKKESQSDSKTFYDDLHVEDEEVINFSENELENIAWEVEEEPHCEIAEKAITTENSYLATDTDCPPKGFAIEIDLDGVVLAPTMSDDIAINRMHFPDHEDVDSTVKVSEKVLDRAVETASNMADWAGRAVRRALKEHLKASSTISQHENITLESSNDDVSSCVVSSENDSCGFTSQKSESITEKFFMEINSPETINKPIVVDNTWRSSALADETPPTNGGGFLSMFNDTYDLTEEERKAYLASSRDAEKMTEDMKEDVMKLIQAFDLPYLIAPYEAEAQCAVLEELNLVDGVITEDSDAFLFGAKSVYKNIFSDKKFVEVYLAEDAKRELGLTRDDFIALAYFLGSDYTEGVHGVGIVNAMEIIHAFPMTAASGGPIAGLGKFKEWLQGYDFAAEILSGLEEKRRKILNHLEIKSKSRVKSNTKSATQNSMPDDVEFDEGFGEDPNLETKTGNVKLSTVEEKMVNFDAKHKSGRAKWIVPESFPDPKVAQAYFYPDTNRNTDPFYWPNPSKEKVYAYCHKILGWSDLQTTAQIDPVLEKFAERSSQTRIDSHFMTYHDDNRFARIASDRLRNAVIQITGKSTFSSESPVKKRPRGNKRKQSDVDSAER